MSKALLPMTNVVLTAFGISVHALLSVRSLLLGAP